MIFLHLQKVKAELGYIDKHHALIIIDTSKQNNNETLNKLCNGNHRNLFTVLNSVTNKFWPLDITRHKKKKFSTIDFLSQCDQVRMKLRISSYLVNKS